MSLVEKAAQRLRERNGQDPSADGRPKPVASAPAAAVESRESSAPEPSREALTLDVAALQKAGLLPPHAMQGKIAREYQRVKRPLLQVIVEDQDAALGVNRIMITSAKPGEGKSFTSMNLALGLAQELDHNVLLVDGDVVSPRLSRALGVDRDSGLVDLLLDDRLAADAVVRSTDIERLSFLPAGRRHEQTTELMASRRMRRLVDELAADPQRIVLFDSAPLLATAESQALALNLGQIVFVVKASHTERRALDSALSLIDQSRARVSLILNQSSGAFGDEYDGYYGNYGGAG